MKGFKKPSGGWWRDKRALLRFAMTDANVGAAALIIKLVDSQCGDLLHELTLYPRPGFLSLDQQQ